MDKGLMKKIVPILITSFMGYFYVLGIVPLGYMYNSFPGRDSVTILIATLPGLTAMVGAFACAPLMGIIGKKHLNIIGLVLILVGGLMVFLIGEKSLILCIVGSSLTGFSTGFLASVNYALLADAATDKVRDKVSGWSDGVMSLGLLVFLFAAGYLAADGNWARAYALAFIAIPVLIIAIIFLPKDRKEVPVAATSTDQIVEAQASFLPKSVIVLIVFKFICALFYMGISLFSSDYIINELQIGTSALVGNGSTVSSVATILGGFLAFLWIKKFKGASMTVAFICFGVFALFMTFFCKSPIAFVAFWGIYNIGMIHHSSIATVVSMAPKGKAIGIATSLFVGFTFVGEFLCGYVVPMASNLMFHSTAPSKCILSSGICLLVLSIPAFFIYRKAYKVAFSKTEETV